MKLRHYILFSAGLLVAIMLAYGMYKAIVWAPTEETMGDAQRIFYLHVPAASNTYMLFFINFIASILYLWKREKRIDAWALSAAEVGMVFATVVGLTGSTWAKYAWGTWGVWDARLTTFLLLWLLYMSYLVLRRSSQRGSTETLAASLAIFAFLDIPINYMSNRWFRTNHPQPMLGTPNIDPQMQQVVFINILAFLAFAALITWLRYMLERTEQMMGADVKRPAHSILASYVLLLFAFQIP